MKSILLFVAALIFSTSVFASSGGTMPYLPEEDNRFDALEQVVENQSTDALHSKKTARATYSFAVSGGSSAADIDTGITLPANSVIVRSYLFVTTALTSTVGAPLTDIYCGTTHNIVNATDITGTAALGLREGVSTGAASVFKYVGNVACNIKVRFSVQPATAGKFNIFTEYVVGD